MNDKAIEALGITGEEVMKLAADKVVEELYDSTFDPIEYAKHEIKARVDKIINEKVEDQIAAKLAEAMEITLTTQVQPRNMWGDKEGEARTIREILADRAKEFWGITVDKNGKPSGGYGGKPRHQYVLEQVVKDAFVDAMKENIDEIIVGFKDALRKDVGKDLGEHIERLIKAPKRR